jgi:iron(III) transport system ATP-binding protein
MTKKTIISIRRLNKTYPSNRGPVRAVLDVDLEVAENEFVVLLGPSGCGKTTTLRCVAGLERPDSGEITIGGELVNSPQQGVYVQPERRDIGMVFQSYAVWPHLNVYQNVALPLTDGRRRMPAAEVRERVMECLQLVQLDGLADRPVTDLSGGQQQRVALARAIVTRPMVLLMDEPLSNLDARLREEMRFELRKIASTVGVTTLYVTHDQAEALSLGDKICVMNKGAIQQVGSPEDVYSRPPNLFVAQFVGEMNFIKGTVSGAGEVQSALGKQFHALPPGSRVGAPVTLAIRPQHLDLGAVGNGGANGCAGAVRSRSFLGDAVLYEIGVGEVSLMVRQPGESNFAVGQQVAVILPQDRWHVYVE